MKYNLYYNNKLTIALYLKLLFSKIMSLFFIINYQLNDSTPIYIFDIYLIKVGTIMTLDVLVLHLHIGIFLLSIIKDTNIYL